MSGVSPQIFETYSNKQCPPCAWRPSLELPMSRTFRYSSLLKRSIKVSWLLEMFFLDSVEGRKRYIWSLEYIKVICSKSWRLIANWRRFRLTYHKIRRTVGLYRLTILIVMIVKPDTSFLSVLCLYKRLSLIFGLKGLQICIEITGTLYLSKIVLINIQHSPTFIDEEVRGVTACPVQLWCLPKFIKRDF